MTGLTTTSGQPRTRSQWLIQRAITLIRPLGNDFCGVMPNGVLQWHMSRLVLNCTCCIQRQPTWLNMEKIKTSCYAFFTKRKERRVSTPCPQSETPCGLEPAHKISLDFHEISYRSSRAIVSFVTSHKDVLEFLPAFPCFWPNLVKFDGPTTDLHVTPLTVKTFVKIGAGKVI
jgi:hypothetical protein